MNMTSHDDWQAQLKRQIQVELNQLEQEQTWWEHTTVSGPMDLMEFYKQHSSKKRGGSFPGKSKNIDRERELGYERIWKDYFRENPVYIDAQFRRRYRMRRNLFWKIHDSV